MNIIKYFKSINIILDVDNELKDSQPSTDKIINWISQYNEFYINSLDIANGNNYHTLYNRDIAIHGNNLFSLDKQIIKIASFAKSLGYGTVLNLQASDILNNESKFENILQENIFNSFVVVIDENESKYLNYLHKIIEYKANINLVSTFEILSNIGVFESKLFNSNSFNVYSLRNSNEKLNFCKNPLMPCANFFRIYINIDGMIYPCLGLLGLKEYSLGSIYNPINKSLFENHKDLKLSDLADDGPQLNLHNISFEFTNTNLPQMCELHIKNL